MLGSKLGIYPRVMPYAVPDGYFEELSGRITLIVLEDKTVIPDLSKQQVFEVPKGYFDQLPAQILSAVKEETKPATKVISLGRRITRNIRLAAAAALLLVAGAGVFRAVQQRNSFDNKLAALPDEALTEYVSQTSNGLNIDNNVASADKSLPEQLTEEEITAYLDETGWQ